MKSLNEKNLCYFINEILYWDYNFLSKNIEMYK